MDASYLDALSGINANEWLSPLVHSDNALCTGTRYGSDFLHIPLRIRRFDRHKPFLCGEFLLC